MAITINGSGITSSEIADGSITAADLDVGQLGGRRNMKIKGAMQVAQRGADSKTVGAAGSPAAVYVGPDRFLMYNTITTADQMSATSSYETDAPEGFNNSFKYLLTVNPTGDNYTDSYGDIRQYIEAQNLQHLKFGTAGAKSLTFSFWVKSNTTGKFAAWLYQPNATRDITKSYTINSANTWEYKTITFDGDVSGVINNNTNVGLFVGLNAWAGTNYIRSTDSDWDTIGGTRYNTSSTLLETSNGYLQTTGWQLEVGSVATPFEHRSYGEELALCQRYYQRWDNDASTTTNAAIGVTGMTASSNVYFGLVYKQEMRAKPSFTSSGSFRVWNATQGARTMTPDEFFNPTRHGGRIRFSGGATNGEAALLALEQAGTYFDLDAEL